MCYIIGIVGSSLTDFNSKIGLNRVTYHPHDPPVSARVNICLSLYLSLAFYLFFSFRSDCIELDFKEISYLVIFTDKGRYCGFAWPTGTITSAYPFEMSVHTDSNEQNGEVGVTGFAMTWTQNAC